MIRLASVIALALLIGCVWLLAQAVRRLLRLRNSDRRRLWRARLSLALTLLTLVALLCGIWATLIEPNRLLVRYETIQIQTWPAELNGLRVAVVGDIHTGGPFINDQKLDQIVALTNQQHPDLIVLLGDYMSPDSWHSHRVEPEVTAAHLQALRAPLGVFAVLGNHDWWYNGEKVRRALEDHGVTVLENDVAQVKLGTSSFWLVGLSDLWTRPQHIQQTLAKIPNGAATIALTHNPNIFPRLPQSVPLLLAAHTHGGQINLPLFGPVVSAQLGKYQAGHVFEDGHHLFITTGIGTSILPVRFRVTPEIVILTVVSGS